MLSSRLIQSQDSAPMVSQDRTLAVRQRALGLTRQSSAACSLKMYVFARA